MEDGSALFKFADIARGINATISRAYSATRLYFTFPGLSSPGYNLFCASRLFLQLRFRGHMPRRVAVALGVVLIKRFRSSCI
jgi:hypothetical protein